MRIRWPNAVVPFLRSFALKRANRQNHLGPAIDFAFRRRQQGLNCFDRTPGQPRSPGVYVSFSGQAPYRRSLSESSSLSLIDVPALTVTTNSGTVSVSGTKRPDWSLRFCAYGDGSSEAEAVEVSRQFSFTRTGSTVAVDGPKFVAPREAGADLEIEAPADAPITLHVSFGAVQVRDMSGPVQVSAIHGRATILNTQGVVSASGFVVDFAGSQGAVILSAEAEINLKFTKARFDGTLLAWAQRPVRVLVPRGFRTAFQAFVNRPKDFVCRTEFRGKIKHERRGALHVFTYDGDGSAPAERVHLRSEHGTVVIDDTIAERGSVREFREGVSEDYT